MPCANWISAEKRAAGITRLPLNEPKRLLLLVGFLLVLGFFLLLAALLVSGLLGALCADSAGLFALFTFRLSSRMPWVLQLRLQALQEQRRRLLQQPWKQPTTTTLLQLTVLRNAYLLTPTLRSLFGPYVAAELIRRTACT